jgi:predicted dehydrogenase
MTLPNRSSRREFLRVSAFAGSAAFAVPALLHAKSPNEKLNVAVVGVSRHGAKQLDAARRMENVVALCDIDEQKLGAAAKDCPRAKTYFDFRKMYDELEKSIDAVMISTPDHTHAVASAAAMRMGKHCYCEKPLAHDVYEARQLAQLAKQKNVVTQMGTQMHACENYRRVVELVRGGVIGSVGEVVVWFGKSWGTGVRPQDVQQPPPYLHWDQWLGPAPLRPYNSCYLPGSWRCWWDFGNGTFGDMSCHIMDLAFWALELRHPTRIEAEGPPVDAEGTPTKLIVRYEFPARGQLPPVKLTWCDGENHPALPPGLNVPLDDAGVLFIGKDGMLWANYEKRTLYLETKFKGFQPPAPSIPNSIGHHKEFFDACKTGGPTTCNFDYGGALTEAVLLGTVAYRVGKRLEWDAAGLRAVNYPAADRYIRRPYRNGWTL